MKIIDTFTFYNELDILFYRLSLLYDIVDKFILVEASKTHKGNDKPLFYLENKERFKEFQDKIVHVIDYDLTSSPEHNIQTYLKDEVWLNENHQRNCIDYGIRTLNLSDEDIIIISDVDEIPNPQVILDIKNSAPRTYACALYQDMYYYNLTVKISDTWDFSKLLSYNYYRDVLKSIPQDCRVRDGIPVQLPGIMNGGWHLSYFGDASFIQNKLKQFAHQELNTEQYTNLNAIEDRIKNNKDLFGRSNHEWSITPIHENNNLPPGYEEFLTKFIPK
jgi:beta-1,4-mannosyl-glycoprotein beta-1,4-N-acetylglucosaminyltransferase